MNMIVAIVSLRVRARAESVFKISHQFLFLQINIYGIF